MCTIMFIWFKVDASLQAQHQTFCPVLLPSKIVICGHVQLQACLFWSLAVMQDSQLDAHGDCASD